MEEIRPDSVIKLLIFIVLAAFGALARELRLSKSGLVRARLVSNILVSIFGSIIAYLVFDMTSAPHQLGYIVSGLVGFGGPQVIDNIFKKVAPDISEYDTKKHDENNK